MIVGVPRETYAGETRVALIPQAVGQLTKIDVQVIVEKGAGILAGHSDTAYQEAGATLVDDIDAVYAQADLVARVRAAVADEHNLEAEIGRLRDGQYLAAFLDPTWKPELIQKIAGSNARLLSMELMPRITRAQSMDTLSSMATVTGYKAVLSAADHLPAFFPMFMTAAGTIAPAKVFILGAGVAGLQAIATAKRLGALVDAYDVRDAVKEQVESLGGNFVVLNVETEGAEDSGGYAKAQSEEFYRRQQELMAEHIAGMDVVITTALIPGRKAPILVTEAMVKGMKPGSVIVDLAAEKGGNCELTTPGETVEKYGVTILGPVNYAASLPRHASQMYSKNMLTYLQHLIADGAILLDMEDEITAGTVVTKDGEVIHPMVKDALAAANS